MDESGHPKGDFDVERTVVLAGDVDAKQRQAIEALRGHDAVMGLTLERGRLRIAYDASRIGMEEIEAQLDGVGVARAKGIGSRIKMAWYRFSDENAKSNAQSGEGACCNRPPPVSRGRPPRG